MAADITTPLPTSAGAAAQFAAAHKVLNEAIAARAFPGCAFGVLAGGKVVLQDALGRFTYEEDAPAVTAETVFDVASLTKVVATTAAAMLLYPARAARPGDTPGRVAAGLCGGPRRRSSTPVTSSCAICWRTTPDCPATSSSFALPPRRPRSIAPALKLPLEAEPGARAEYSDPGFILLGKALEVLTRESLAPWVRREVFSAPRPCCHRLLSGAGSACGNSPHRRGQHPAPSPHSGRGAG